MNLYEVTVEDPEVLLHPWVQNPMLMTTGDGGRNSDGLVGTERGNCQQLELDDIATQYRH